MYFIDSCGGKKIYFTEQFSNLYSYTVTRIRNFETSSDFFKKSRLGRPKIEVPDVKFIDVFLTVIESENSESSQEAYLFLNLIFDLRVASDLLLCLLR